MIDFLTRTVLWILYLPGPVLLGAAAAIFMTILAIYNDVMRAKSRSDSADIEALFERIRALNARSAAARSSTATAASNDDFDASTGNNASQSGDSIHDGRWDDPTPWPDYTLNEFGDPDLGYRTPDERFDL